MHKLTKLRFHVSKNSADVVSKLLSKHSVFRDRHAFSGIIKPLIHTSLFGRAQGVTQIFGASTGPFYHSPSSVCMSKSFNITAWSPEISSHPATGLPASAAASQRAWVSLRRWQTWTGYDALTSVTYEKRLSDKLTGQPWQSHVPLGCTVSVMLLLFIHL